MPVWCMVPGCHISRQRKERSGEGDTVSHHRLPSDVERCKQWLRAIKNPKYDENTPTSALGCLRVCSLHFAPDDYNRDMRSELMEGTFKKSLKSTAVPNLFMGDSDNGEEEPRDKEVPTELHDTGAADIQENAPAATGSATGEKPALQHIVDEEAILQLIKDCPMCDRKCRCTKFTRGPYFIVYQSCYFCNYQRKWASQPEARDLNIHKAQVTPKRKQQPKDKVSGNAKAASSKLIKTRASSVSESQDPIKTRGVPCQLCLGHD